jgi:hypothetical protein
VISVDTGPGRVHADRVADSELYPDLTPEEVRALAWLEPLAAEVWRTMLYQLETQAQAFRRRLAVAEADRILEPYTRLVPFSEMSRSEC